MAFISILYRNLNGFEQEEAGQGSRSWGTTIVPALTFVAMVLNQNVKMTTQQRNKSLVFDVKRHETVELSLKNRRFAMCSELYLYGW